MNSTCLPKHVAIIMDGNGRWAQVRRRPRVFGHIRGTYRVREVVTEARSLGIQVLTLYAFSTENWRRPLEEVQLLFKLLRKFLDAEESTLRKNDIQLRIVGDLAGVPEFARAAAQRVMAATAHCKSMVLNLAINYGGQWDIVQAANRLVAEKREITTESLGRELSTAELPAVDLVIRTGGDHRISNFLLWQAAYAELMFIDLCWPDFDGSELRQCLNRFGGIDRRYGGVVNYRGAHGG